MARFAPDDDVADLQSMCGLNQGARCFLAIEIEGKGSRKHTMGGMINAAALGKIGIATATDEKELRKQLMIRRYLIFLSDFGKSTIDTRNLLVVTTKQLANAIVAGSRGV